MEKGLLMLYTGDGEGSRSVVRGQVFRSLGRGFRVCVIEFTEGSWEPGLVAALESFGDRIVFQSPDKISDVPRSQHGEHSGTAEALWRCAKEKISSGKFNLVVLDGPADVMERAAGGAEEMAGFLANRPQEVHVMVAGKAGPESLVAVADLVSDVAELKAFREPASGGDENAGRE
jgi:cob(I)alamin adenosyltransferase